MNYKVQALVEGNYYHIFNRGNNRENIFFDNDSYIYFLQLYRKYITPVADTYAWCLLKNHFHILVYLKTSPEIIIQNLKYSTVENPKVIEASKQFSHLFNAYTQAINKKFNRTGSLFEKPFERKLVSSEIYLEKLIFYIHNNPISHGFVTEIDDYPWSSYGNIFLEVPHIVECRGSIEKFGSTESFVSYHKSMQNLADIHDLIIE
ncbi:MAG TPA: hypothetical protein VGB44_00480 [Flavobacterium sp.]|jgi:REP element-mobilizing transposase RayT